MIKYLDLKMDQLGEEKFKQIYLSYDNICHMNSLKLLQKPLPLPPPKDKLWENSNHIIALCCYPV